MKNGIWSIMRKELARFFGDKRMVISSILLPGILIYVAYSFMGTALNSQFENDAQATPTVCAVNLPESLRESFETMFVLSEAEQLNSEKNTVTQQELDALVVFSENFDAQVAAYRVDSGETAPAVEIYYNSASTVSAGAQAVLTEMLSSYETSLTNKFDVLSGAEYDLASEEDTSSMIFSMMLPMLLMMFLFSGCMSVAPESIAGEKERGTIATLLITPVKRSHIALGKVCALSIIALLSGLSSTIGTFLALPKLMGGTGEVSANIYSVSDYLLLGGVILSTVLVLVVLIAIISAFAKSIKEAQAMVLPLMVVNMFLGITAMFGDGAATQAPYYLIPLYNSVQCMMGVLSLAVVPLHVLVTVLTNLAVTALGIWLLTRMFRSERIIFSK